MDLNEIVKCSNCGIDIPLGLAVNTNHYHTISYACPMCIEYYESLEKAETWMQVTREMAHDGGDLSMEGMWIKWD